MKSAAQLKTDARCTFDAGEGLTHCEACAKEMPKGASVYFISDGGEDPRKGTHAGPCCVDRLISEHMPCR